MSKPRSVPWSVRFRREREQSWTELEKLVDRCERGGLRSLSPNALARLPVLYRATVSALGVARSSLLDQNLRDYLEALVARAYLIVYSPKRSVISVFWQFLTSGFPATVRSIRWQFLASWAALLLGGVVAFAMVKSDASNYFMFVDRALAAGRDPTASTAELREALFSGGDHQELITFTVFLFTHNSSVGILAYGLGFALGMPVLVLLLSTGLMLGAMTALYHERGLAIEWWSWILPHGVTEITAIVLCGAAGLAISHCAVFPGRDSRLQALAKTGRRMGAVVAGGVGMFLVAGFVEGIFRQVVQSLPVRYAMAATFACLWIVYFSRAGRRPT